VDPFIIEHEVEITPTGARRLRDGHLWVYAGDVVKEPQDAQPAIVKVIDAPGNCLGYALYSRPSQIRLRLFNRGAEPPTLDLLQQRIAASIQRRASALASGRACRLIYGEADRLPSVIVDRYDRWLVLQTMSKGAEALKESVVEILKVLVQPAGILERNDLRARRLEGLEESSSILWGEIPDYVRIEESGITFDVDLRGGQKTGFFLDQTENRIAARRFARGQVLDCFTNTGGFALHFARTCESVLAVEISPKCIELAKQNASLNGATNVSFHEGNVFDYLRELERAGRRFDLISLDPPAFAKSRSSLAGAKGGYKEINLRAMRLLRPEGILVTSSCSYHLSESQFMALIDAASRDARRYVQVLERRSQASDHPVLASMPETHYLKCFILRLL
jgi:23S rRNA (cytosine1962-C5)-methyltransferase